MRIETTDLRKSVEMKSTSRLLRNYIYKQITTDTVQEDQSYDDNFSRWIAR